MDKKVVAIKADADNHIGIGHLVRSLILAKELKRNNIKVIFFVFNSLMEDIINNEFEIFIIKSQNISTVKNDYIFTNNEELEYQKFQIKEYLVKNSIDFLIIDSFNVDKDFFKLLNKETKLVYFDSFAKEKFDIDILINTNYKAQYLNYTSLYGDKEKLLGVKYYLIRDEFKHSLKKKHNKYISSIMISTGGTDQYGLALKILKLLLKNSLYSKLNINLVVNDKIKDIDKIIYLSNKNQNISLYSTFKSSKKAIKYKPMNEVMLNSDIAIAASGITLYELLYMGIPTIAFTISKNQERLAKALDKDRYISFIGSFKNINKKLLSKINFFSKKTIRVNYSNRSKKLINGNGAINITKRILKLN